MPARGLIQSGLAPGREAPPLPTRDARLALKRMIRDVAGDVMDLDEATLRRLVPLLAQARRELKSGLAQWLKEVPDGAERFTAQHLRRALVSVQGAIDAVGLIEPRLVELLQEATASSGVMAIEHVKFELARISSVFGDLPGMGLVPTQIDAAAIVAHAKKELIPRFPNSAARYVGAIRDDIRNQFGVGLARGETFDQLTNRLRKQGGPRGLVALRGKIGEPGALVEDISEGLFRRYRHWAERLTRTEVMNAYNSQHNAALLELNKDRDEDEEPFLRRWEAALDKRVCPICKALNGLTAPIGKTFPGEYVHPPAHPNCRCVVVPWHPSWGNMEGEVKAKSELTEKERGIVERAGRARKRAEEQLRKKQPKPRKPKLPPKAKPPTATQLKRDAIAEVKKHGLRDLVDLEGLRMDPANPIPLRLDRGMPDPATVHVGYRKTGKVEVHLTDGRHRVLGAQASGLKEFHARVRVWDEATNLETEVIAKIPL